MHHLIGGEHIVIQPDTNPDSVAVVLPCRLCPHVVVMVGLEHFDDPWGYAVEPLLGRRVVVVRFRYASDHQT